MQKIKIRLPATITNLGPGLNSLGLAVGLYTSIEIRARDDESLHVNLSGEGSDTFDPPEAHPVVNALHYFFEKMDQPKPGIDLRIDNQIPLDCGLGAEAAFAVAGILGANNLVGNVLKRDELLTMAAQINSADGVVASLMGGLTVTTLADNTLIYRNLSVVPFQLVIVLPEVEAYSTRYLPQQLVRDDVLHNIAQLPFMIEALRTGDRDLLAKALDDRLLTPRLALQIPGYESVVAFAKERGALAITTCGDGPALVAITERHHQRLADDMVAAFIAAGRQARGWVVPVDTQGVVVSVVQST